MSPTEAGVRIPAIEANAWALNAPDDPKGNIAFPLACAGPASHGR